MPTRWITPFYVIADLHCSMRAVPPGALPNFRHVAAFLEHSKIGKVIVTGGGSVIRSYVYLFTVIYQKANLSYADTLEEAEARIARLQAGLCRAD